MAKRKTAKYSILVTVLCLVLCGAMVLGGTYAWFSDSATSEKNVIAAGELKVGLSYSDSLNGSFVDVEDDDADKLFDYARWEPGYTTVKYIKVENKGNLAFKFDLKLLADEAVANENDPKLSDVIDVYFNEAFEEIDSRDDLFNISPAGTLNEFMNNEDGIAAGRLLAGESKVYYLVLHMQEAAGNEYQGLTVGEDGIDIQLYATQYTAESDSFGSDYDSKSHLPVARVYREANFIGQPLDWNDSWGNVADGQELDTAYVFEATDEGAAAENSPYADWHADFVVTFDRDVTGADGVGLGGNYGGWGWIGLEATSEVIESAYGEDKFEEGKELRLLNDVMTNFAGTPIYMSYEEICDYVQTFACGAWADVDEPLTMTVELRLYEVEEPSESNGYTANKETNNYETIGSYKYTFKKTVTETDIAAALASGGEIALAEDISLTDSPLTISADTVIDLNGHTLSGVATNASSSNLIKVSNGKSLTLKNGTVSFGATTPDTNWGGVGQPAYPGYANNTINVSGKLIIDGATIENKTAAGGASYAIDCYPGADLIINSGKINGMGKTAIRMFANSETTSTNVTINGGEITGSRGIWVQLPGSNISSKKLVHLTINGGTITATKDTDCALYSYSYGDSFAETYIDISGGIFNGDVCFGGGSAKSTVENVTITGGTFNGELGRYLINDGWEDIAKP